MNENFIATNIQSAVISSVSGGWKKVGNIVFVDMKFNLTASYKDAVIMKNLPAPKNGKTNLSAANISGGRVAFGMVKNSGDLEWHDSAQPSGGDECSISGIYNCT